MYTLYHMLSFILFIVPIFLIYLLSHLLPGTSRCSFRLQTAGYQKRVGRTPTVARSAVNQHLLPLTFKLLFALLEGGPLVRVEGHLGLSVFEL